jgi:polyhydroxyalkanoate synthesis regulator phasin
MKRLLEVLALLLALGVPALAQSGYPATDRDRDYAGQWQGRISPDDQKEFNEHYKEWQEANAKNDTHDINKHARKMSEIMARYNIPRDTPFDAVATASGYSGHYDVREFQGRFSNDDQKKFDKAYEEWLEHRRKGDRDDVAKEEGKMQELMARYNIPRDLPYDALASGARGH